MASQWTTAARHDRMAEIREQLNDMNREAGGDQFDQESRDTWNTLNAELDEHRAALDELRVREERLAEAAADPNPDRSESGHDSGVRATATTVGGREAARSAGLRAIDRYRDVLPTDAGDRLDHHVREQDVLGHDARYLAAVAEPAYESAFIKMLKDPQTGHLRFSPKEVDAVRAVSQADQERAMAVGTGSTGGFGAPFQIDPSIMISGTGSQNPFRTISRVETVTGYEWRGVSADQVTAHYRAEATEVADDSPTLVQPVVTPRRGDAFVPYLRVSANVETPQVQSKGGYDLHSSVEVVDKDLARRILAGNVRGVFDRVIEVREPHEVCSPSPIPPAVDLLDDSKELRHAP